MMDIFLQFILFFFQGESVDRWLFSKLIMGFIGGVAAYLINNQYFNNPGETKLKIKDGLWFSFFSAIAGVVMLNPPTSSNAFMAGLLGVAAMTNLVKQNNEGATGKKSYNKKLTASEIKKLTSQNE